MRAARHRDEHRRAATTVRDAARTALGTFVREAREAYVAARGDVPREGFYNWDPGAQFGCYRPDRFWLKP